MITKKRFKMTMSVSIVLSIGISLMMLIAGILSGDFEQGLVGAIISAITVFIGFNIWGFILMLIHNEDDDASSTKEETQGEKK